MTSIVVSIFMFPRPTSPRNPWLKEDLNVTEAADEEGAPHYRPDSRLKRGQARPLVEEAQAGPLQILPKFRAATELLA